MKQHIDIKDSKDIPQGYNIVIFWGLVLIHVLFFFVAPLVGSYLVYFVATTLYVGSTLTMWAFLHEGVHSNMFKGRLQNRVGVGVISTLWGASFVFLKTAHLLHHKRSRVYERNEVYKRPQSAAERWRDIADYYVMTLGGVYLSEFVGSLICFLGEGALKIVKENPLRLNYYIFQHIDRSKLYKIVQAEILIVVVLFTSSAVLYGDMWPLLLLGVVLRGVVASWHDYAYHYGETVDSPSFGLNAAAPTWVQHLLLNFNYHGVHHQHPSLPWTKLPAYLPPEEVAGRKGLLGLVLRQLKGPVFMTK